MVLRIIAFFCTFFSAGLAASKDLTELKYVNIDIQVNSKATWYFSSGPSTTSSSSKQFIQLERLKIGGELFWSIYGAPSDSCNVDSRFTFVKPLFKIGGSHIEKIRCSAAATNEAGVMVAQAKGSLSGSILSVSSNINGDVTVLGVRTKKMLSMAFKIDISSGCKVISVSFTSEERSSVNHSVGKLSSFSSKCSVY